MRSDFYKYISHNLPTRLLVFWKHHHLKLYIWHWGEPINFQRKKKLIAQHLHSPYHMIFKSHSCKKKGIIFHKIVSPGPGLGTVWIHLSVEHFFWLISWQYIWHLVFSLLLPWKHFPSQFKLIVKCWSISLQKLS